MVVQLEQSVMGDTLAAELVQIAERVRRAVVVIDRQHGNGAGIIWRSDGGIVTNRHVVGRASQVHVRLADGRRADGQVVARHPEHDLAVVHVPLTGLPAAEVGDSSTVRPGHLAIAVGHPFGYRDAVSVGVIVAAGHDRLAHRAAHARPTSCNRTSSLLLATLEGRSLMRQAGSLASTRWSQGACRWLSQVRWQSDSCGARGQEEPSRISACVG
ncbi:MAG: hypothetical protein C4346_02855 [Chloroflexota bacterium]